MTLLGHMLPGWQGSATCCQDDTKEAHWLRTWVFTIFTIFSWSLSFFQASGHFFLCQKIFCSKEKVQTAFIDFLASKTLKFYRTGINNPVNRWQRFIDLQGSYFNWLNYWFRIKILSKNRILFSERPNIYPASPTRPGYNTRLILR